MAVSYMRNASGQNDRNSSFVVDVANKYHVPQNAFLVNPINPYASTCLISSIGLLCHVKNEPSYTYRGDWL